MLQHPSPHQLVLGIGNPLRGDDGVGALLAEQAGGRCVHQLTPELAADLAPLRRVLFIDAWRAPAGAVPQLQRLSPVGSSAASHHLEPAALLAVSQALYGRAPAAQLLRVPAHAFEHGMAFSPPLRASLPAARELLRRWLQEGGADA